ncbi:aspartate carbamoyltransferase catalytic subunit [Liquorilactobacillus satsumensis]|uniref:aspartate carbamoyltransferase catalytic subunit n=1 Tax=Liquorilactobacillus satsumensis TaxID=259059 RepID=UPI0021C48054|nr:aspartate carbamoyltransferase catalytic subunit [Liquorilactobacillus satsumensis]MCP9311728.1 aspartate carbamoyltransferase catalytic subunit [Liquorilactobacillus satsumensis]MCP9358861.1 aspartate carbamoyltransferase catalytic subunit [Liquorilactobacillus satsumensis]
MVEVAKIVTLQHFLTVKKLQVEQVESLIARATFFKNGGAVPQFETPLYAANLFFENSTRTHCSFEMAERKLGLQTIPFDPSTSSVSKGETLYDTLLALESIGVNLAVIRHSQNEYYRDLVELTPPQKLEMGIVNAGDGSGQHPSQSLLDMMTIAEQFGSFTGLKVVIVGDLTNSRVARSNMELLQRLGAQLYFSGPRCWYSEEFAAYGTYRPLDEVLPQMDVVMLLRVQHERHQAEVDFSAASYHTKYGLTEKRYAQLKEKAIIMHPGPINRGVELSSSLVEAPKSRFTTQMQNGVFMRMAMLESVIRGRHLGGR